VQDPLLLIIQGGVFGDRGLDIKIETKRNDITQSRNTNLEWGKNHSTARKIKTGEQATKKPKEKLYFRKCGRLQPPVPMEKTRS